MHVIHATACRSAVVQNHPPPPSARLVPLVAPCGGMCLTDKPAAASQLTDLFEKHGIVSGFAFLSVHVVLGVVPGSVVQPADVTSWPYTAPTATTFEAQAGIKMPALLPLLPLAATQMIPASAALLHASEAAESSQSLPAQTQRRKGNHTKHHRRQKDCRRQLARNANAGSVNNNRPPQPLFARGKHCCKPCPICALTRLVEQAVAPFELRATFAKQQSIHPS
mgnify:CR=1 FL=1